MSAFPSIAPQWTAMLYVLTFTALRCGGLVSDRPHEFRVGLPGGLPELSRDLGDKALDEESLGELQCAKEARTGSQRQELDKEARGWRLEQ